MWRFVMRVLVVISLLALSFQTPVSARLWTRNDPSPSEIKARVPYYCDGSDARPVMCESMPEPYLLTMDSVHEALLHCPKTKLLDISVSVRGYDQFPDRWNFPFYPDRGGAYPALRELRVRGYHFGSG